MSSPKSQKHDKVLAFGVVGIKTQRANRAAQVPLKN